MSRYQRPARKSPAPAATKMRSGGID
jgi:hypothetical protein